MSVVAGCSLFDGVLLAADCRVTVPRRGAPDVHLDCAQKIFPLTPNAAIGFVGNVRAASMLLQWTFRRLPTRQRQDPISLMMWLPRFLRYAYQQLPSNLSSESIAFMVASAVPDRCNVIARKAAVDLMNHIGFGKSAIQRSWIPDILVQILGTDPKYKFVAIPGTSMSLLYIMESPSFIPQQVRPLQFAAIGSGRDSKVEIAKYHDMVVAGQPGNSFVESTWFRGAIDNFLQESSLDSVGGLLPIAKITRKGIEALGVRWGFPDEAVEIELIFDQSRKRWIQRNTSTGKEIVLLYPWEIPIDDRVSEKFDDFLDAHRRFRGIT